MTDKKVQIKESNYEEKTVKKVTTVIAASAAAASNIKEAKIQLEAAKEANQKHSRKMPCR